MARIGFEKIDGKEGFGSGDGHLWQALSRRHDHRFTKLLLHLKAFIRLVGDTKGQVDGNRRFSRCVGSVSRAVSTQCPDQNSDPDSLDLKVNIFVELQHVC
jgi:hypothetical protein